LYNDSPPQLINAATLLYKMKCCQHQRDKITGKKYKSVNNINYRWNRLLVAQYFNDNICDPTDLYCIQLSLWDLLTST